MSHGSPRPLQALRRAKLDNLTLVPASLLPFRKEYQAIANQQPPGTIVVIVPHGHSGQRRTLELFAEGLRARGQSVHLVSSKFVTCLR